MAQRPATILQIVPDLDTGGAERSTVEIAAAIVRAGGRAIVATRGGRLASELQAAGGELVSFPAHTKNPLRLLANAGDLGRLIRSENVDLVHARSRAPAWSALVAARRSGRPFVTTYHGAYGESGHIKRLYNSVMARGDVVIANSDYTGRLIRERYGTPQSRITVIPRGVDTRAFDPRALAPERLERLRSAWRLAPGERILVHAARLTGWKGQRTVVEAADLARHALGAPPTVILAGDAQGRTDYLAGLEAEIARRGLEPHVRLVGHCDDIAAAFALATAALVVSEEPEAFGRAAIEAQAMACPVIATRLGAPAETVLAPPAVPEAAATGWLIAPKAPRELAGAMVAALALSAAERTAMGARARANVEAAYSLAGMQRATLAVYDRLIGSALASAFSAAGAVG